MRIARNALRRLYEGEHDLFVTPQNISEFWNVCTRPIEMNGLGNSIEATDRLTARIEEFFSILPESMETFNQWRQLVRSHAVRGAKVHDARLAATVVAYGLDAVLTFNLTELTLRGSGLAFSIHETTNRSMQFGPSERPEIG